MINICEGCAPLSPEEKKREIPYLAVCLLMGAKVWERHLGKKGVVGIEVNNKCVEISDLDYSLARALAEEVGKKACLGKIVSAYESLDLHRLATKSFEISLYANQSGLKKVIMLKDKTGSGYWRMVQPTSYMDGEGLSIDITAAGADIDKLRDYDTIFVQRIHDWEGYYLLARLKKMGKRIVYDIDDDIFNIPTENPAFRLIGRDEQMAAAECMKLADVVTVTTDSLQTMIRNVTEGVEAVIIPNGMDMDDGWVATPFTGCQDGWKRIFWQGGESHSEDWTECADAIDAIMGERKDVRVTILGFLPKAVRILLKKSCWKDRVEFLEFSNIETYLSLAKHVRAEVGIAPLQDTLFNRSKSPLKFMEYAAMGIPTVASGVLPYSDVIDHGNDGFLVNDSEGWFNALTVCLDNTKKRLSVIEAARRKVRKEYDIKEISKLWKKVLISAE